MPGGFDGSGYRKPSLLEPLSFLHLQMLAQQRIQTLQKEFCNELVLHIKSDMHRSKTEILHKSMREACLTQQQPWTFFPE